MVLLLRRWRLFSSAALFFPSRSPCTSIAMSTTSFGAGRRGHLFLTGNPGCGKTTLLVNVVKSIVRELAGSSSSNVSLQGFYTREDRQGGERVGFDIVRLPRKIRLSDVAANEGNNANYLESIMECAPLSRIGTKGSGPMVGKYVVNVESIQRNAIPLIDPTSADSESDAEDTNLLLLDEVGKMEMLCPGFLEAVNRALDCDRTIVFGTIPTPRYGRVIKAVEDIRARSDVTVVYCTKTNREELRGQVTSALLSALQSDGSSECMARALSPYLYKRAIGAPSMSMPESSKPPSSKLGPRPLSRHAKDTPSTKEDSSAQHDEIKACGPLMHPSIPPKVLLLGETASPQPDEEGMEYAERSMWTVLGEMVGQPLSSGKMSKTDYQCLRDTVTSSGIAVWDVLSGVHIKGPKAKKSDRKKKEKMSHANPIVDFVSERDSIEAIAFIGAKAKKSFAAHFCSSAEADELVLDTRGIQLIVLPSSSRANSRMTVSEKASEWRKALLQ